MSAAPGRKHGVVIGTFIVIDYRKKSQQPRPIHLSRVLVCGHGCEFVCISVAPETLTQQQPSWSQDRITALTGEKSKILW